MESLKMSKNVYIVQKWLNEHWRNLIVFSSEKKANYYVSEISHLENDSNFRVIHMPLF